MSGPLVFAATLIRLTADGAVGLRLVSARAGRQVRVRDAGGKHPLSWQEFHELHRLTDLASRAAWAERPQPVIRQEKAHG